MDNFTNDIDTKREMERKQEQENIPSSQMKDFTSNVKPQIPDFVQQTKQWIKDNPSKIREVAPELVEKINEAIDGAPMGLGGTIRNYITSKYPEAKALLEPSGTFEDAPTSPRDAPGQDFAPGQQETYHEPVETLPERSVRDDDIPDEVWDEAIAYMADRRNRGYTYSLIAEKVWNKYGIDVSPTAIQKYVMQYEEDNKDDEPEPDLTEPEPRPKTFDSTGLKMFQQLMEKNKVLADKNLVLEKAIGTLKESIIPQKEYVPVPATQEPHRGLLRRLVYWLI